MFKVARMPPIFMSKGGEGMINMSDYLSLSGAFTVLYSLLEIHGIERPKDVDQPMAELARIVALLSKPEMSEAEALGFIGQIDPADGEQSIELRLCSYAYDAVWAELNNDPDDVEKIVRTMGEFYYGHAKELVGVARSHEKEALDGKKGSPRPDGQAAA